MKKKRRIHKYKKNGYNAKHRGKGIQVRKIVLPKLEIYTAKNTLSLILVFVQVNSKKKKKKISPFKTYSSLSHAAVISI